MLVMGTTLASTMLGFGREIVSARYYGTRWEMDTFLAAATIPTILFGVFNGALVTALVPAFSKYIALGQDEEAWSLASTVFNMLAMVLVLGAILGWIFAPWYVPLIAHGFPAPQMQVAIRMTRWLMPGIVATSLAGVASAMLNANQRFTAAAFQGIAINIVTILTVTALYAHLGIYAVVLGTVLGLCAQLFIQLPSVLMLGRYRPRIDLHHPGLKVIGSVLGPIVIGSAAGQIALFFDRFFASTLSPGYLSGMNYAAKIVGFPQQVFAAAIATVIFPLLASQFASDNIAGVRRSTVMGLRMVNFITIPAVCGIIVLSGPIVTTLFERGAFDAQATELCASLLPFAALGLVALAANTVLTRCCFACHRTTMTVVISMITVTLNVVLSLVWLPSLGARGLLLANAVSQTLEMPLLLWVVRSIFTHAAWQAIAKSTVAVTCSSLGMMAALYWIVHLKAFPINGEYEKAGSLLAMLAIGTLIFLAIARLIGVEELSIVRRLILEKFARNVAGAAENRGAPIA